MDVNIKGCHTKSTVNMISPSYRLTINENNSGMQFLIDTGSDSPIILCMQNKKKSTDLQLFAANNTVIKICGKITLTIYSNLDVLSVGLLLMQPTSKAIIGAEFLHNFNLLVDTRNNKLTDSVTKMCTVGKTLSSSICIIKMYQAIDLQAY